jgi:hypothetical protein
LGLSDATGVAAGVLLHAQVMGTMVKAAAAAVLPRNFLREMLFLAWLMFFISYGLKSINQIIKISKSYKEKKQTEITE